MFGFNQKTGIDLAGEKEGLIPTPQWKEDIFEDVWRLGDTYNTAIGQYGFQITPIQAVRMVAAIANSGELVTPHLVRGFFTEISDDMPGAQKLEDILEHPKKKIPIDEEYFKVVREGMRQAVTEGTASGLNISAVKAAAKTGTAEVGTAKKFVNSWIIGFFPYDNPKYAFTIIMEHGPSKNTIGALYIARQLFEWMAKNTPEYLEVNPQP